MNSSSLPSHIALVARRLNQIGSENSADTFLITSYLAESMIKTLALVLRAGIAAAAPELAYRFAHGAVRADGLGEWESVIRESSSHPIAGYLPPDFRVLLAWLTKRRTSGDEGWFGEQVDRVITILELLGSDASSHRSFQSVRDILAALVVIRNRTKAHGAVGPDFFAASNDKYIGVVTEIVRECPAFAWKWIFLSRRGDGRPSGVWLFGMNPIRADGEDVDRFQGKQDGVYFLTGQSLREFWVGDLLRTNRENSQFLLPNGGHNGKDRAEFIDYGDGTTQKFDVTDFSGPPAPLPKSETEGLAEYDIQSNVFGNLPPVPKGYIERVQLQAEIEERLLDRNHPIITLHGRGGIGKTSLALYIAHRLAGQETPRFERIVWFSARDLDLRITGAQQVRQEVSDLESIAKRYGTLFEEDRSTESFAKILQGSGNPSDQGTLFVFDNFETLRDTIGVHRFLDTYTHLPNKVMITSRERAFKADFPIEVRGMEFPEAAKLMRNLAEELSIAGLIGERELKNIYEYTDGHPYVMRILIGEIAKEKRVLPLKQIIPSRLDILSAVFERSFNGLSDDGRWVFLTVANWRSIVFETALIVVLARNNVDVENGIEECHRLSLIDRNHSADGERTFSAPELAREFASKKLFGDPDRLAIEECLVTLRHFGVLKPEQASSSRQKDLVEPFLHWAFEEASEKPDQIERIDFLIESVAQFWPRVWLPLAKFRIKFDVSKSRTELALRRAVEENPSDREAIMTRAEYGKKLGDEQTWIACLVSAVDANPNDVDFVREAAFHLATYVDRHKSEIPTARRGVYLASLRSHMERLVDRLDATGLSRLAWLYLLENQQQRAYDLAMKGCEKESTNSHCLNILERLENAGFVAER